jgi:hypothetical protein
VNHALASLTHTRVRLVLLLVVLAGLTAYLASSQFGLLGLGSAGGAEDCPAAEAPSLASLSRAQLLELREELRGVVGNGGRLYEQGLIEPGYMWSDGEPGTSKELPPGSHPGGYELRWWLPDGDDVVVDGMVFAGADRARGFYEQAASTDCRPQATVLDAPSPPGGSNLVWRNPDGYAQEDLFLLRGRRVYRVAVVLAGVGDLVSPVTRHVGFSIVNRLACALPEVVCGSAGTFALTRQGADLAT